ncbi:hypothetical protein QAD02_020090 [Eretmocerus hayati]|uniref:Uncharacterized protein n=1 Tax=Eretmocerus hayati TaxID=131215 RepID=A0ACC2PMN4_9HYME|nr:hypothetical protein QAD02_020090 [Eretmocerus hayati]
MTHPGLAVMLVVGVGLGAMLYYFFANPPEPQQTSNRRRNNERSGNHTHWAPSSQSNPRNRRPDPKCMICLDDTNKDDAVRIIPCCHVFHQLCIEEWRVNGAGEAKQSCPNCRNMIEDLEEL